MAFLCVGVPSCADGPSHRYVGASRAVQRCHDACACNAALQTLRRQFLKGSRSEIVISGTQIESSLSEIDAESLIEHMTPRARAAAPPPPPRQRRCIGRCGWRCSGGERLARLHFARVLSYRTVCTVVMHMAKRRPILGPQSVSEPKTLVPEFCRPCKVHPLYAETDDVAFDDGVLALRCELSDPHSEESSDSLERFDQALKRSPLQDKNKYSYPYLNLDRFTS